MKYILLLWIFFASVTVAVAQPIPRQTIEDSVIGWVKLYNFKGVAAPQKVADKIYSPAQLSICDSFANWMQASYVPKGALGDVKKTITGKLGLYNKNDAALPQSYGAYAYTYFFLKYNSSGKMVPENNLGVTWGLMANGVPGWEVRDISTPTHYYFTMPSFEAAHAAEDTRKKYDLSNLSNVKPHINFWIKNIEAGNGTNYVLLCKNNQSPFVKLTKGEYLQLMQAAIPRYYETEKKKISEANPGNQRMIDYLVKALNVKNDAFIAGLKANREKYKDRLAEPALTSAQPGIHDLEGGRDLFSNGYLTDTESDAGRHPVYKIDSLMAARCKENKPQWVLMSWWWSPGDPVEKNLHESIVNNFNFGYVYNFFFDPEKVKGQAYKPLRSPYNKEAAVITEASEASRKNTADKNIYFFEDFSTTGIGEKPNGWRAPLGPQGSTGVVEKPDGLDGNWVMMNDDYSITATQLKKPFPPNFTLSYDLVAAQNFTWGAKGLMLQLSNETSPGNATAFLKLRLRPGYDGRDGETTFETKFAASGGTKWAAAPGFSNNKKNNRIAVTIKKNGETLQVFIDKNKVLELEKAIPAAQVFNAMSFSSGSSGENNKYYISNVKIVKE
ncbi:MAG: hypothetical protein WCF67_08675 [Chitinophagaceae bacterium]